MRMWLMIGVLTLAVADSVFGQEAREASGRSVGSVNPRAAAIYTSVQKKSWFQRFFSQPTWEEAVSSCRNPGDVCRMAERYIMYQAEERDTWSTARATWQSRRGDCEDFAILINEMCRERGWDSWVELYFPSEAHAEGHAIVMGRYNGKLWISNMGSYEEIQSLGDVRTIVAGELECDPDTMWSCQMKYADIQRFLKRGHS